MQIIFGDWIHRRPLALDRKTCRPIPTEITFAREGIERCGSISVAQLLQSARPNEN
jgi:hypothetical protein